jgi:DNA-binding PadR family transcriptional regulator
MNYDHCPCSGNTLPRLVKPAILALLLKEPQHGYVLVQRLGEMAMFRGQAPDAGGVYKALRELEESGMVVSEIEAGDRGLGRKVFSLTEGGRGCCRKWHSTLGDYRDGLDELLLLLK